MRTGWFPGKRRLLAEIFFQTGLTGFLSRHMPKEHLVVLNYHRLRPAGETVPGEFDDSLFDAEADQFYRQMEWLKKNALVLSEADLLELVSLPPKQRKKWKKPLVAVTFDDGYRDNYTLAYPVLTSLDLPAFFFIAAGMIESRRLEWWDLAAYLIKNCCRSFLKVAGNTYELPREGRRAKSAIAELIKTKNERDAGEMLAELAENCGVMMPSRERQSQELMTWEQIRKMTRVAIGSHAVSHRAFSYLDGEARYEELLGSKKIIEEKTGRAVVSLAYPFGAAWAVPEAIVPVASSLGYKLGFTSSFGSNKLPAIRPLLLNRIAGHLESVPTVSLMSVLPRVFTRWGAERNATP